MTTLGRVSVADALAADGDVAYGVEQLLGVLRTLEEAVRALRDQRLQTEAYVARPGEGSELRTGSVQTRPTSHQRGVDLNKSAVN